VPWYIRIGFRAERWFSPDWLPAGEVPGDAVKDFNSIKDCELSVYVVHTEDEGVRAATAIAARRYQDKAVGYALFDRDATNALGIRTEQTAGESADPVVNTWHRDLKNLTFAQLAAIARLIKTENRILDIPVPAFKTRLSTGVTAGQIDRKLVEPKNLQ
jgi:hypothetical protein